MVLPVALPVTLLAIAVTTQSLVQTDLWVALVSGREVAQHGLPSIEHLTVVAQGQRWVDQQWLAQFLLYELARLGGVGLVVAACTGAFLAAFAIAAATAQARGASPIALLCWLAAAFAVGPWGAQARTQSLALALFAVVLWLVLRDPALRARSSLWALAVLCLWANLHGSVTLGAAIVCGHGLQSMLRTGRRGLPVAMFLLAPATVLASPYCVDLPGYYRRMLLDPPFGHNIVEWQATTPSNTPLFFVAAATVGGIALARRREVRPVDWLVLLVTFAAALSAVRITPWFGLAILAVMPPLTTRRRPSPEFSGRGAAVASAVTIAAAIGALAWLSQSDYDGQKSLIASLRSTPRTTRVFANLNLADWVLWEAPDLRGKVAYDGRPEILTRPQFANEARFARLEPGWPAVVRGYSLLVTNPTTARIIVRSASRWRIIQASRTVALVGAGRS